MVDECIMTFITGRLIQSKDSTVYEGIVYARRLVVQGENSTTIYIFDPHEPISTDLQVDKTYEMVLVPFVGSVEIVPNAETPLVVDPSKQSGLWQGKILNLHWLAQKDQYHFARPDFYDGEWILVETSLGNVLVSLEGLGVVVDVGAIIQWDYSRLDLYAVV
jgi:hypothetical protein